MVLKDRLCEKKKLKFAHFMLAPVKVLLCGARDFTISTFCACAGRIGEGSAVMMCVLIMPQVYPVPGKYNSSGSTKEKRSSELIRVTSTRNAEGNTSESNGGGRSRLSAATENGSCQRSYSIGVGQIGRIDEDGPCDFVETDPSNKNK